MNVPFLDSNPEIAYELSTMDHNSKEYKKILQKVLIEIGGPICLFNYLKTTDEGNRFRKKYLRNFVITVLLLISLFIWIFIAVYLTDGKEIDQFAGSDIVIFIGFVVIEIASIFIAMIYAFRCKKILLEGGSYLLDNYQQIRSDVGGLKLSDYKFARSKNNKIAIIVTILIFVVFYGAISLGKGTVNQLFAAKTQEFTKAGLTITLTQGFHEQDVVSQTATYASSDHIVICLKEEFYALKQSNIPANISLEEYAEAVIRNNNIETNLTGDETRPYFIYSRQINGKEFSYLTMVFKGSDAFWTVTFACETKKFDEAQGQFIEWADTIEVA